MLISAAGLIQGCKECQHGGKGDNLTCGLISGNHKSSTLIFLFIKRIQAKHFHNIYEQLLENLLFFLMINKIRDLFKVKLYTLQSYLKLKKSEGENENEIFNIY